LYFEIEWDYSYNTDTFTFDQTIIYVDRCLEGSGTVDITTPAGWSIQYGAAAFTAVLSATYTDVNGNVCSSPDLIYNV
jgi:hypothetical protein